VLAWNWVDGTWAKFTQPNLTYGTSGLVSSAVGANIWSGQSQTWEQTPTVWSQNDASSNEARLIVATSTPTLGLANAGSLDFGTRVSWYLEKVGIPLSEDGDSVRPISKVRLRLDATSGTQVTAKLATTMNPDDVPTFSTSSTYTQGTTNYVNQFTNGGRYGAVRYEGADDQPLAMRSYQLDVPQSGARF
jgi:hypothetical protein